MLVLTKTKEGINKKFFFKFMDREIGLLFYVMSINDR